MNQESENFDLLRRLLALKRHEQPPPGYFNNFSAEVVSRLRTGEARGSFLAHLLDEAPWLQNFWRALETKPAFVGLFGVAVCGLLMTGILRSEVAPRQTVGGTPTVTGTGPGLPMGENSVATFVDAQPAGMVPLLISSTNPVAPGGGSLFDQVGLPTTQPASYIYSGNP